MAASVLAWIDPSPAAPPEGEVPHLSPVTLVTTEDTPSPWVVLTPGAPALPPLTLTLTTAPAGGRLELDGARRGRFHPAADWHGDTTFRLRACTPQGLCRETENMIRVQPTADRPQAPAVTLATARNRPSHWLTLPITDPDQPPAGTHRLEVVNPPPPTQGVVEVAEGRVRFVPAPDWWGQTQADLVICHGEERCSDLVPVTLQVPEQGAPPLCLAPVARAMAGDPAARNPVPADASAADPSSDGDPPAEAAPADVPPADVQTRRIRAHGAGLDVQLDAQGRIAVRAAATLRGESWYLLEVCGADALCATCRGRVRIDPVNHPPTLTVPTFVTAEDTPSPFLRPTVVDPDPDDDWRLEVVTAPDPATGTVQTLGTELRLKPAADWSGATTFTLRVCDRAGACSATQDVPVTVRPVNDPPRLTAAAVTLTEDQPTKVWEVPLRDPDSAGPYALAVVAHGAGVTATVLPDAPPRLALSPQRDAVGVTPVTVQVCDNADACALATVAVTVTPVNDPPQAASGTLIATAGGPRAALDIAVLDPDTHDHHQVEIIAPLAADLGTLTVAGRTVHLQPAGAGRGTAELRVCDAAHACSAPFPLTVSIEPALPACTALHAAYAAAANCPPPGDPPVTPPLVAACYQEVTARLPLPDPEPPPAADAWLLVTVEDQSSDWLRLPEPEPDAPCADATGHLAIVAPPPATAGTLEHAAEGVRFVPAPDWAGRTSARIRRCAATGACGAAQTVALLVAPVPDAPRVPAGLIELQREALPAAIGAETVVLEPRAAAGALRFQVRDAAAAAASGVVLTAAGELQVAPDAPPGAVDTTHLLEICDADDSCTVTNWRVRGAAINQPPRLQVPPWVIIAGAPPTWHPVELQDPDPDARLRLELLDSTLPGTVQVHGARVRALPAWGWTGEALTHWRVCDEHGACSAPTAVPVRVTDAPDAPRFPPVTLATREDTPTPWQELIPRQADPQPPYTLMVDPPPRTGAVLIEGTRLQYQPGPEAAGEDPFGLVLCDARGRCTRQPGSARVAADNDPPQPRTVYLLTREDESSPWLSLAPTDPDADERHTLDIRQQPPPEAGTTEVAGLNLRFHPAPHWFGATALTYRVCDAAACSDEVTLPIRVTRVGDAPRLLTTKLTAVEDTPTAALPLAFADDDPDDRSSVLLTAVPTELTVSVRDQALQITPGADVAGTYPLGLTVCDRYQLCTAATVTVTITAVPDPPQVAPIDITLTPGARMDWLAPRIQDPDGATHHQLELLGDPDHGQAEVQGPRLRYRPTPDFRGETVLSFRACAAGGRCSPPTPAHIRVVAPDPPPPLADLHLTVPQGESGEVALGTPDTADDTPLRVRLHQPPGFGEAVLAGRTLRYTAPPDAAGTTHLLLEHCAPRPPCVQYRVPITVTPRNQPPVLMPLTLRLPPAPTPAPWVRAVIEDPDDAESLRLEVVKAPQAGRIEVRDTELRYLADASFRGEDRLVLRACDAQEACSPPATFLVRAATDRAPAPQVDDATLALPEDSLGPWLAILPRVHPTPVAAESVVELTTPAEYGQCQLSGQALRYRPPADWSGVTSCDYRVCRTDGACSAPARLTVTVTPQPDPPRLGDLPLEILETTTRTVSIPVFDADDADGQQVTLVHGDPDLALTWVGPDLEITPRPPYAGTAHFTLQACDAGALCTQRTYTVTVRPLPDPPRLTSFTLDTTEDTPSAALAVPIQDADAEERFTLQVLTPPEHGRVAVTDGAQPTLRYTPDPDYEGADDLLLQVCDHAALCNDVPVTVTVAGRNDPPQALTLVLSARQDLAAPFTRPTVTDPDRDDRHQLSVLAPPAHATVELGSDQLSLRALPQPGWSGRETFPVRVCDLRAACLDATAELVVQPLSNPADTLAILPTVAVVGPSPEGRWPLVTAPLKRSDTGALLTGKHTLFLDYAADGRADLRLGEATLRPGGRLTVPDYDFAGAGGRLALALGLAAPASAPNGPLGQLRIVVDGVPTAEIGVQLTTWNPATQLMPQPSATVVARHVQRLEIPVTDPSGYCAGAVLAWTTPAAFAPRDRARGYCALEWLDLPAGQEQDPRAPGALVVGTATGEDATLTLAWRAGLVYFDQQGLPRFFPSGEARHLTLDVIAPPAPTLLFRPDRQPTTPATAAGGFWPLPAEAVALVSAQAPHPGLTLTLEPADADPAAAGLVLRSAGTTVQGELAAAPQPRTYRLAAAYTQAPTLATTATLTLGEPASGRAVTLHGGPTLTQRADEALVIRGSLVTFTPDLARWRVQLLRQLPGGQEVAWGPEVEAGVAPFAIDLGRQEPGDYVFFAEARDVYGTGQRVHSAPLRVTLVTPTVTWTPTLTAATTQGLAPLATTLTAQLPAAALPQLQAVTWEMARDSGDYTVIATTTAPQLRLALPLLLREPGRYHYRVRMTLTGNLDTLSAPLPVQAYQHPVLRVQGYPETLLGSAVEWSVSDATDGAVLYQWESPALAGDAQGARVRLQADTPGRYPVTLRARYASAPEDPAAWATWRGSLLVAPPFLRAPSLSGPHTVYEGQVYRFVSPQEPVIAPDAALAPQVRRLWRRANGQVAVGETLVLTAAPEDTHLDYSVWLDEHEAATRITSRLPLRPEPRPWPRWLLQKRLLRGPPPARVFYALVPETPAGVRDLRLGQELRYDLEVPAGGEIIAHDRHTALLQFNAAGQYPVRFTVSDRQGRTQTVEDQLEISAPPPLVASVRPFFTDRWQRTPLEVTLRWSVEGLAAGETLTAVQLLHNGTVAQPDPPPTFPLRLVQAGRHELVLRVRTNQERTTDARLLVLAERPMPPRCQIEVKGTLPGDGVISAACTAPMGRVGGYHWRLYFADGGTAEMHTGSQRFQLARADRQRAVARIELIARDERDNRAAPVIWTPGTPP